MAPCHQHPLPISSNLTYLLKHTPKVINATSFALVQLPRQDFYNFTVIHPQFVGEGRASVTSRL